uniref:Uncharacterized protein n=1 Tax=Rhizophora mucronata TaxID=61149 RepID=A0A2P2QT91_RHIMU
MEREEDPNKIEKRGKKEEGRDNKNKRRRGDLRSFPENRFFLFFLFPF